MNKKRSRINESPAVSFKAFLSHSYKAITTNSFFFKLFGESAEVQFEVDENKGETNVTRLERMIRDADAFIGIYPLLDNTDSSPAREALLKASRYFRLELDMALRARKPAIIFYDERYGDVLQCPEGVRACPFDWREISGKGRVPSAELFRRRFEEFCELVQAGLQYKVARLIQPRTNLGVGLMLPFGANEQSLYSPLIRQTIEATLQQAGYHDLHFLNWPPVLNAQAFSFFERTDWVITDLGEEMIATGMPAYLHGQFVPLLRLKHVSATSDGAAQSAFESSLFGGVSVGYQKNLLLWQDATSLAEGLGKRLQALKSNVRLIKTAQEAEQYFLSAGLRPEAVFLSYSGKDIDLAAELRAALKLKFQKVFDYKDGESIRPGEPWLKEIFEQLVNSKIAIPLLSNNYLKSGNCLHEAQQIIAQQDNQAVKVFPVKVRQEEIEAPPWLQSIQYLRYWDYQSAEDLVQKILQLVGP